MIRRPAAILALLTALNFLSYIDRWVLAAVLPLVQDELHLSNAVAGSLGTVFLIGYFATSPIFGRLADKPGVRGGRKGLLAIGVAAWSVATFVTGFTQGAWSLMSTRAVVGVGEASYATVAPTIIDDMAPPQKKGRWLSIFYVAIPVGSALGFVIGAQLSKFGWREAFWVVGGPGLVAAFACLLIAEPKLDGAPSPDPSPLPYRSNAPLDPSATSVTSRPKLDGWRALVAIPLYRRAVLGYSAQTFAIGGFGFWAPKFIHSVYGLSLARAGSTFGGILVVSGALGTWVGGTLADRGMRRANAVNDDSAACGIGLRVCAWSSILATPLAAACFWAPSATGFFVFAFACETAIFASTSPINAVILRAVPNEVRASAMALSIFAIHVLGDLWSPPLLGVAQDHFPGPVAMMGVPVAIALSALLWWRWGSRAGSLPAAAPSR